MTDELISKSAALFALHNDVGLGTSHPAYECIAALPAVATEVKSLEVELRELLPDDLYDSKDWRHANSIDRIKWLITMLANKNEEIEMWVDMINRNNDLRKDSENG